MLELINFRIKVHTDTSELMKRKHWKNLNIKFVYNITYSINQRIFVNNFVSSMKSKIRM